MRPFLSAWKRGDPSQVMMSSIWFFKQRARSDWTTHEFWNDKLSNEKPNKSMYDPKSNNCFVCVFLCRWEENPSRTRLLTRKPKWNPECILLVPWNECLTRPLDSLLIKTQRYYLHLKRRAYQFHIFDLNIPAYNGRHTAQCTFHHSNMW